ncbi:uncharacterized protein [Miscanthus floridulus]|uniref:uncharacterized protein n=1 Tax=Miscanthus floridulus TaxID=154761 RepID=UPI0034576F34
METQLNELTQMMKALQAQNSSIQRTLDDNLATLHDVGVWRPKIDVKVDELHQSVVDLQQKVDSLPSRPQASDAATRVFDTEEIDLTKSAAPHHAATSSAISLPIGAGVETSNRGIGHGVVTTLVPTPIKGRGAVRSTFQGQQTPRWGFIDQALFHQMFPSKNLDCYSIYWYHKTS